jgi:hypothetical protein
MALPWEPDHVHTTHTLADLKQQSFKKKRKHDGGMQWGTTTER